MTDWRVLHQRGDWSELSVWWQHIDDRADAAAFIEQLRRDVPSVVRRNGMEERVEHVLPDEAPSALRVAAEILHLGELEMFIEEEPAPFQHDWNRQRADITDELVRFTQSAEVTLGEPALSRTAHASEALKLLEATNGTATAIKQQLHPKAINKKDRAWLDTNLDEIVFFAFNAGLHAQSAIGKEVEQHAVRGLRTKMAASEGGSAKARENVAERQRRLTKMHNLIAEGHTGSRAASLAYEQGFGPSANANRQLLKRHPQK